MKTEARKTVLVTLTFLAIFGILSYSLFQAKNLITGPVINIEEPRDGATLTYDVFDIKGDAKNISSIKLNDSPIFVNEEGKFSEKIVASPGYSVMKLEVEDRFGKKKTKYLHLVLPKNAVIGANPKTEPQTGTEVSLKTNNQTI